jgi:hypothetical protein
LACRIGHLLCLAAVGRILIPEDAAQGGRICTVRDSRGDDEMAACGQLGTPEDLSVSRVPMLEPPPQFASVLKD